MSPARSAIEGGLTGPGPARVRFAKYSGFTVIQELRTHSLAASRTDIPHLAASAMNRPAAYPLRAPRFDFRTATKALSTSASRWGESFALNSRTPLAAICFLS